MRRCKLGEIAEFKTGPFGTQFKANEYTQTGVPVINVKNIGNGLIIEDELEYISDTTKQRLSSHIIHHGDIVFARKGSVERHAYIDKKYDGWVQGSDCIKATISSEYNSEYISYYLYLESVKQQLLTHAVGSTMPSMNTDILSDIDICYPTDATKVDKVVSLLRNIKNKIALNNRLNATLEAMAKTLYDYWFVQFDFPDEKGRPYKTSGGKMVYNEKLGREIPAGWEVKRLSDFVDISTEAENPLDNPQTFYEHYSIPAYDEGKYPFIERGDSINSSKYVVKSNSLLYAKLNPTFKRLWAPFCFSEHAICSTEFVVLELRKKDHFGFVYSVLNDNTFQRYMEKQASSSTGSRRRVQPDNGLRYSIVDPPDRILKRFSALYEAIVQRNKTLIIENHRLTALRDWLLPMLMNGQAGFR